MKKIILIIAAAGVFFACNNDFLELTPTTQLGETAEFWENESSLETYSNGFYNYIDRAFITTDFSSDNSEHLGNPPPIRRGVYVVPTSLGSGGWSWTQLRNINYFIEKVGTADIDPAIKSRNIALAKFFRSWFYFNKVKEFGDVPWYSNVLETDSEEMYKPRDSRVLVMDSVLSDLNYSIEHLPEATFRNKISKWTALALKSRVSLYEGTWRKYHADDNLPGVESLLQAAAASARELMDAEVYSLYSTGDYEKDYFNLFQPKDAYTAEVILARSSDTQTFYYTPLFTSTSNGNNGATRDLVSSYLMKNGQTLQEYYPNSVKRDTMTYYNEFKNRDPRLSQTLVYPGYVRVGTNETSVSDFAQNATGYMIHKRVGPPIEDQGGGYRDVIMIRYAEVLLNYAEAKAELGQLSQEDIDMSVNRIRDRVNMPPLSITAGVDAVLDDLYRNTSDAMILEVRRERRIELAFEGFRMDDLKRWEEGHLFRAQYEGVFVRGLGEYIDLNEDKSPDLFVYRNDQTPPSNQISGVQYFRMAEVNGLTEGSMGRIVPYNRPLPDFQDWEYLNPIPTEELTLNPQLQQTPGWE